VDEAIMTQEVASWFLDEILLLLGKESEETETT